MAQQSNNTATAISTGSKMSFRMRSMSLEGWKALFEIGGVILLGLTFVFGIGLLITGNRINALQDEQLRQFDKKLTDAQTGLKGQQERAAIAEGKVAGLEKDAADAKGDMAKQQTRAATAEKALLELQERVKDRHLSAEQKILLAKRLRDSFKGQLEIRCMIGNPEGRNFALEIMEVFTSSGWQVTLNDRVIINPPPVGLKVWTHSENTREVASMAGEAPERITSILKAFEDAHLVIEPQFSPDIEKGNLSLIVGFKP